MYHFHRPIRFSFWPIGPWVMHWFIAHALLHWYIYIYWLRDWLCFKFYVVTATLTVWGNLKYCAINKDNEPLLIVSCAYKQGVYSLQFLSPPVSLSSLFLAVFLSRLISVTPSSNYGPHMKCLCVREIPVVLLFECISLKLSIWVILVFSRVYSKQARLENVFIRELLLFFRTPKNLFFRIYSLILLYYEDRKKDSLVTAMESKKTKSNGKFI